MTFDPDAGLREQLLSGDSAAISQWSQTAGTRLKALARRVLGDAIEAEDVTQEVLLRAWKALPDWKPSAAKLDTWMHRVMVNLCIDRLRARRPQVDADGLELRDDAATPEEAFAQKDRANTVATALNSLPERQRIALSLCYYQDLPQTEAASAMDLTLDAYESLLRRARNALKTKMETERGRYDLRS